MPYLGPGVDQVVSPGVTPTWAFTPNSSAAGTGAVRFYNNGNVPVFIGQNQVTQYNGIALQPGNKIELWNVTKTYYACSGAQAGTTTTTSSANATAGTVIIGVSSVAGFTPGSTFIIGSSVNGGQEVGTVAATAAGFITASTNLLYDHASGVTVSTATPSLGILRISA